MGTTVLGQLLPVGSVIHSMLTEGQFQAQMGSGWVLSDGRSVSGSSYASITGASTIPDVRGTFLRAKDNGVGRNADGDLTLGTYTSDKFGSHTHIQNPHTHNITAFRGSNGGAFTVGINSLDTSNDVTSGSTTATNQSTGSNETSPKSTIVNVFIRIN